MSQSEENKGTGDVTVAFGKNEKENKNSKFFIKPSSYVYGPCTELLVLLW